MVLIGAGNLGQAIARYIIYGNQGFNLCGAFDINENLIGKTIEDVPIYALDDLENYVEENQVDIAIICVNRGNAQGVVDRLAEAGIKGIWNFALVDLDVPEGVSLESVHLSDTLHSLVYHMNDWDDVSFDDEL